MCGGCGEEDGGWVYGLEVGGGGACAAADEALFDLKGVFEGACIVEVAEVAEWDEEVDGVISEGLGDGEGRRSLPSREQHRSGTLTYP